MADTADPRSIATHLAAALIAGKSLENSKGGPATAAARIYFDVLDAVKKEQDRRYAGFSKAPVRAVTRPG